MILQIITPDETIFTGETDMVQLPGIDGKFAILNNHAPLISVIQEGRIKIRDKDSGKDKFFSVKGGVVEVLNNKVLVLAE